MGHSRRVFLGALGGLAAGAVAGCDAAHGQGGAAPSSPAASRGAAPVAETGDADWPIRSRGPQEAIEGYAAKASVAPGEAVPLHVSTTARGFRVSAYRMGWYEGAGAKLVWRSGSVAGRRQSSPAVEPALRTVTARWEPTVTVPTDGWRPGAYLLRLDADNGHQRYVPLVVRSDSVEGKTVLVHAVTTWQAYNLWGGYNLYNGLNGSFGTRSLMVSFDRPYDKDGAEKFQVYEQPIVMMAEQLGLPVAYTTSLELATNPGALKGAAAAIFLGHDEYWTPQQRAHVTAARDAGTNLAFLGANTCYRRIRLDAAGRTVTCYKDSADRDPMYRTDPALVTTDFRLDPAPDPESSLLGVYYDGFPVDAPYVVHTPDHWLYAGTGVRAGDSFKHLVGVEYDRVNVGVPTPRPIEILAHSPVRCEGRASHSDTAYYTAPSGAGVFASGTMRWVEGTTAVTKRPHGMDARTGHFVQTVTRTLLTAFAAGPAGHSHPAPRDNVRAVYA